MKKRLLLVICLVIALTAVTGCSKEESKWTDGKLNIVTTTFATYDWAKEIVGDAENVDVAYLLKDGVDMHSFQPSADDIISVTTCDLLVYVGGESEEWITDAINKTKNPNQVVIKLLDVLGSKAKEEEIKEGMQASSKDKSYDEHVWLSVKNAQVFCQAIANALNGMDDGNSEKYTANVDSYKKKLDALDDSYTSRLMLVKKHTLVVGDRFPFRYLLDDYKLDYYAAFPGCSAESEASFETITFLAKKIDELGVNTVVILENSKQDIANTIISNTKTKAQAIRLLDSMQSATLQDYYIGKTYIKTMESNLEALLMSLS